MASVVLPMPEGSRVIEGSIGALTVPDNPAIPVIVGDGIGIDVTPAMQFVIDAAVSLAYGNSRRVFWWNVPAGKVAYEATGQWLPGETLDAIRYAKIAIKGPLTTPVGTGIRSVNVQLRQELDLFACIRPVRWFHGVPSPVCRAEDLNIVIFRENMEDLYLGIEFEADSDGAQEIASLATRLSGQKVPSGAGIGIKPISRAATERIARSAIEYALRYGRKAITIVHKGNIMKFTEGAFRKWAYGLYLSEYRDKVVTEEEIRGGEVAGNRIVVKDRIADAMFQELLLHPLEHSVVLASNLNGDYLSDAAAAQVGGLGLAPGANVGDECAVFEATHGTAPRRAGQDKANPGSLILSAVMMLETMGWTEAAFLVEMAIGRAIASGKVTYDLAERMAGAQVLSTTEFARSIVDNMALAAA